MKEPEMRTIRWSLWAIAITTPAAAIETTYNQAQRSKKDNYTYPVAPEMLTSLPSLHRNLVNKFLQEKSFSSAILEKFLNTSIKMDSIIKNDHFSRDSNEPSMLTENAIC
jgi:hypothetical protein